MRKTDFRNSTADVNPRAPMCFDSGLASRKTNLVDIDMVVIKPI
jgi:hypothetical protein